MKHCHRITTFLSVTVLLVALGAQAAGVPQLTETAEQREQRLQWFRDAKFGLFIHWGPSAISGAEISWGMKDRIEGGRQHMKVPRDEYMNLYKKFNPVNWNPDELFELASQAGMQYVVFVTKHHDGFTLWPTRQKRFPTNAAFPVYYSIADTPYKKDPIRMVQQAARKRGLRLGWYYSTRDWTHPDYLQGDNRTYNEYYENQVEELLTEYGPVDLMWFDHTFGKWDLYTIPRLFEKMYSHNPGLLVNNRAARGLPNIPAGFKPLDSGDFDTPENRMGTFQYGRAWESCMILSPHADHGGWSYRPDAVTRSLTETLRLLSSAACGDGNMLLNLAPLPDGSIRPEEAAVLKGLIPWMKEHGEAIHKTRGGPWSNGSWGGATHRGRLVYLHIFEPGDAAINLRALPQRVLSVAGLDGTRVPFRQTTQLISITVPSTLRNAHVTILKLTLEQPVTGPLAGPAFAEEMEDEVPGTIALYPASAALAGGLRAQDVNGVSSIGYWTNPQGSAAWPLGISSPASYQVRLCVSNPKPGAKLLIDIGGTSFTVQVPNTGSHDNYRTIDVGRITFANAEQTTLRVTVADKENWQATNIRYLKLLPSNR